VASIRTIIWHLTNANGQRWGPIPSPGGRLEEPYRTSLIRYVTEIRRFGFARLTVSFAPQQTNNPLLPMYEPSKFRENWRFIETVRALVKRYGPRDTRIDLLNEGAPTRRRANGRRVPRQTANYLRTLYRLYVGRFGNRDVSISAISWDMTNRVRNLVRILDSTRDADASVVRRAHRLRHGTCLLRITGHRHGPQYERLAAAVGVGETLYDKSRDREDDQKLHAELDAPDR